MGNPKVLMGNISGGIVEFKKKRGERELAILIRGISHHDVRVIDFISRYLHYKKYIPAHHPLLAAKFAFNFLYNGIEVEMGVPDEGPGKKGMAKKNRCSLCESPLIVSGSIEVGLCEGCRKVYG